MDSINKRNTSDFFLPHQQLPPVEQFLKSLGDNNNNFGIKLLPDITFLRQLSIQGRLRYFDGDNTTSPYITITPTLGETLFIYRIVMSNNSASTGNFQFINSGNVRFNIRLPAVNVGGSMLQTDFFDSLVGDSIQTMTIDSMVNGSASIWGWVENTARIRDVTS